MLLSLRIENFALIDDLELHLGRGLNILTGETGTGKSIILEAIDVVLGGKVTLQNLRSGSDRAVVAALFSPSDRLWSWLQQQNIKPAEGGSLLCSRELTNTASGFRSRCRLNGTVVSRQQLELLRGRLVMITAQGQALQLAQPDFQREGLDEFGGAPLLQARQQVRVAYSAYQQTQQLLTQQAKSAEQQRQEQQLWEFQIQELQAASLGDPEELERLEAERQRLGHRAQLEEQSYRVYQLLYENDHDQPAAADLLGKAERILTEMAVYDQQIQPLVSLVGEALAQIQEVSRQVYSYREQIEADPTSLQQIEERVLRLKQICRKYGPTLADALERQAYLQTQLAELNSQESAHLELATVIKQQHQELTQACTHLTALRTQAARDLEAQLVEELKPLAMGKVQFKVEITPTAIGMYGADQIDFLLSFNPGEPLGPLRDLASGGEMSRFLLAFNACFPAAEGPETLVFDEIDTGVSGRVSQAIALKMQSLSQNHQILCVTHQPITAAMADHHFQVHKQTLHQRTVVRITQLNEQQRRQELAQLAAGSQEEAAIAFASSLLDQAQQWRRPPA